MLKGIYERKTKKNQVETILVHKQLQNNKEK